MCRKIISALIMLSTVILLSMPCSLLASSSHTFQEGQKYALDLSKQSKPTLQRYLRDMQIKTQPLATQQQRAIRHDNPNTRSVLSELSQFDKKFQTSKHQFDKSFAEAEKKFDDEFFKQQQSISMDHLCAHGHCKDKTQQAPAKVTASLPALSALFEAGRQSDQVTFSIFQGHDMHCRQDALHSLDCCHFSGWAQSFTHCNAQEKALKQAHSHKLTIQIGHYCRKKVAGKCLQHVKTFCVFKSKLARLIQRWGRFQQLGMDFGTPKHPDCHGLTPNQLQRINLDTVHFDSLKQEYAEILSQPLPEVQGMSS